MVDGGLGEVQRLDEQAREPAAKRPSQQPLHLAYVELPQSTSFSCEASRSSITACMLVSTSLRSLSPAGSRYGNSSITANN